MCCFARVKLQGGERVCDNSLQAAVPTVVLCPRLIKVLNGASGWAG